MRTAVDTTPEVAAVTTAPPGLRGRLGVFFELGKLKIVELWLGFFVAISLLGLEVVLTTRALPILALILVSGIAVIAATCSLDDIAGVRDGVDQANHRAGHRWGVSKPILAGRLSERRALRFVRVLAAIATLGGAAAIALAWPLPAWLVVSTVLVMLLAVNYSYGLKLSYHGAGELVIFMGAAFTVLVPYGLVAGTLEPVVLVDAALVGSWHAQVVVCSNTHDREGDRATSRLTIAARTSGRGNKLYVSSLFAASWALAAVALAARVVPVGYAAALAPVWALQLRQLWLGVRRERWLDARLLGFRVIRLGIVALTIVNLLVLHRS